MKQYSRVTYEARCQISAYLQAGFSKSEIARKTGYHKSTISREIKRNSCRVAYSPTHAQKYTNSRYKLCRKPYKLSGDFKELVERKLLDGWSPDQISGRFRKEIKYKISHESIYKMIRKHRHYYAPLMRRMRLKRGRKEKKPNLQRAKNVLKISERPKAVENRSRIGDWERDTMLMKNRAPVLVCVERKSKYTKIALSPSHTSLAMNKLTEDLLTPLGRKVFSVTNDRGTEFIKPIDGIKTYYCDPRTPQQRGTVENTIGLLRQYAKTSVKIRDLNSGFLSELENKINNRPRKCLNYLTPHEVFFKTRVALAN